MSGVREVRMGVEEPRSNTHEVAVFVAMALLAHPYASEGLAVVRLAPRRAFQLACRDAFGHPAAVLVVARIRREAALLPNAGLENPVQTDLDDLADEIRARH